jgi:hypothetical protein
MGGGGGRVNDFISFIFIKLIGWHLRNDIWATLQYIHNEDKFTYNPSCNLYRAISGAVSCDRSNLTRVSSYTSITESVK